MSINYYYVNLETGELLTYADAKKQAVELYDVEDPTNSLGLLDYYGATNIPVK